MGETTNDPRDWVRHVIWWHVYPLGFTGAYPDPEDGGDHGLDRIVPWLDHLVELGLSGLALGPIFASATHGYDTLDFDVVDARLGGDEAFDRLVAECRRRGIRILLDGVFNHVAPAFAHQGWIRRGADGEPETFEGHGGLLELDHDDPDVADAVVEVMSRWLERGADGWRLDAAYAVDPRFWARVLPRVRERHPSAWFTGEVIHGDFGAFVTAATVDSVTQYELWQGIWHAISDRNLFELAHAIERDNAMLDVFVPTTFLGNHDVTRLSSAIGADFVPHAVALLCTLAGTPMIYAGDEDGLTGVKEERFGGDDAVRPAFADAAPAADALSPAARALRTVHHDLLSLRRQHAWLHSARTDVIDVTNTSIVLRTATADDGVVTALNLADGQVELPAADAMRVLAGEATVADSMVRLPPRGWAVLSTRPSGD
ncbi:alpha-amylase family glycosyl hydrolase [Microbacterium sp. P01]|uniref:alpha-amylase family glycosyl hydrolase n=1 Tax=Microbacterium sp. P01 TaxID=3366261 RepID=UPI00366F1E57